MASAQAEPPRIGKGGHCLKNAVEVEERLAHAHEDDVGQTGAAFGQSAGGMAHLVQNLGRLEVAAEAKLAGGAERATDGTAGLARDAKRVTLPMLGPAVLAEAARGVVHQHRLDERPIREQVQRLLGQPFVRDRDLVRGDRVDAEVPFKALS